MAYGATIFSDAGDIQIDSTLFPYELAATARFDPTGITRTSIAPRLTIELNGDIADAYHVNLINPWPVGLPYYDSVTGNDIFQFSHHDCHIPILMFRPDGFGAKFTGTGHRLPAGGANYTHNMGFWSDTPGDVRIYLPKFVAHWRIVDIRGEAITPFKNISVFTPPAGGYGMLIKDDAGIEKFDSRKMPLMFSRFQYRAAAPGSPYTMTYSPMGRRPFVMLNELGIPLYGMGGGPDNSMPLWAELTSDGVMSFTHNQGQTLLGLL